LGNTRLKPVMMCNVTVKTGERTLLAYLMRRFSAVLIET
jgi:hypothetical protein